MTRRHFIQSAALTGGAILSGGPIPAMADDNPIPVPAPRVARFERMAFCIFLHFGLYSQMEKGEWVENMHKVPRDEYLKLMKSFTARDFSGRKLAQLAKRAGAKYVT